MTKKQSTVTFRLFTHIVSTEKMRKYMRDREYTRGTKYAYSNSYFLMLRLIKSILKTFKFLIVCLLLL